MENESAPADYSTGAAPSDARRPAWALLQARRTPELGTYRLGTQYSALSTQHSALSTQHSALSTQHSALSTQHSALVYSGTGATSPPNSTPFRSRPSQTTTAAKAKTVEAIIAMLTA